MNKQISRKPKMKKLL